MKRIKPTLMIAMAMLLPVGVQTAHAQLDQQDPLTQELPAVTPQRPAKPTPVINKTLVGWQEPVIEAGQIRISESLSAHWVQLNATDGIDGRVVGIADPIDVFLLRNGFVVASSTTLADGSYRFEACSPGPYTIVGYSREAIFATGFLAVANDGTATGLPQSLVNRPVVGAENNTLIAKLIQEFAPDVDFREYGIWDIGEGPDDPPQFFGFAGLKDLQEPAVPSVALQSQPIRLAPGGRLVGRIHQSHNLTGRPVEVTSSRVMIVQDGEILAEVQVDNAGVFEITDLEPGEYGLVAVGADGIATIGLELVQGSGRNLDLRGDADASVTRPQLIMQVGSSNFRDDGVAAGATMIGPEATGWLNNYVSTQVYVNALTDPRPEYGPGGFGAGMPSDYFSQGGGGGGSGGGFFGGGFDNWILPLGIGALIYAGTDNNNGFNNAIILPPPPQSPF